MSLVIDTTGHGPALVLIHGWALHGGVFAPLVKHLREDFTVHCVSLPGHGRSRDDTVPFTLDACMRDIAAQIPQALWVGWSLGGLIALKAAAHGAGIRALAMLAATPRFTAAPDWPEGVAPAVLERFSTELAQDYRGTLERFVALGTLGSPTARQDLRLLRAALYDRGEPTAMALAAGLDLLAHSDLRHLLPQLAVPSLWMAGARDRLVHPHAMAAAAALAPRACIDVIAGAGHAPFLAHAEYIATALRALHRSVTQSPIGCEGSAPTAA